MLQRKTHYCRGRNALQGSRMHGHDFIRKCFVFGFELFCFFVVVVLAAGFANTGMERLPEVSIVVH